MSFFFGGGEKAPKEIRAIISKAKKSGNLDLRGKKIPYFYGEICAKKKKWKVINMNSNELQELPKDISKMALLTELILSNNKLKSLPAEIGSFIHMTKLDVCKNQLQAVPETIGELTKLLKLVLNDNDIVEIPRSIGALTLLTALDLSNNSIGSIPDEVGQLVALTHLNVGKNRLKSLPTSIGELAKLKSLDCCGNELITLPASVGGMSSLRLIKAANNRIATLPKGLGETKSLRVLDLKDNPVTFPPEQICSKGCKEILAFLRGEIKEETPVVVEEKKKEETAPRKKKLPVGAVQVFPANVLPPQPSPKSSGEDQKQGAGALALPPDQLPDRKPPPSDAGALALPPGALHQPPDRKPPPSDAGALALPPGALHQPPDRKPPPSDAGALALPPGAEKSSKEYGDKETPDEKDTEAKQEKEKALVEGVGSSTLDLLAMLDELGEEEVKPDEESVKEEQDQPIEVTEDVQSIKTVPEAREEEEATPKEDTVEPIEVQPEVEAKVAPTVEPVAMESQGESVEVKPVEPVPMESQATQDLVPQEPIEPVEVKPIEPVAVGPQVTQFVSQEPIEPVEEGVGVESEEPVEVIPPVEVKPIEPVAVEPQVTQLVPQEPIEPVEEGVGVESEEPVEVKPIEPVAVEPQVTQLVPQEPIEPVEEGVGVESEEPVEVKPIEPVAVEPQVTQLVPQEPIEPVEEGVGVESEEPVEVKSPEPVAVEPQPPVAVEAQATQDLVPLEPQPPVLEAAPEIVGHIDVEPQMVPTEYGEPGFETEESSLSSGEKTPPRKEAPRLEDSSEDSPSEKEKWLGGSPWKEPMESIVEKEETSDEEEQEIEVVYEDVYEEEEEEEEQKIECQVEDEGQLDIQELDDHAPAASLPKPNWSTDPSLPPAVPPPWLGSPLETMQELQALRKEFAAQRELMAVMQHMIEEQRRMQEQLMETLATSKRPVTPQRSASVQTELPTLKPKTRVSLPLPKPELTPSVRVPPISLPEEQANRVAFQLVDDVLARQHSRKEEQSASLFSSPQADALTDSIRRAIGDASVRVKERWEEASQSLTKLDIDHSRRRIQDQWSSPLASFTSSLRRSSGQSDWRNSLGSAPHWSKISKNPIRSSKPMWNPPATKRLNPDYVPPWEKVTVPQQQPQQATKGPCAIVVYKKMVAPSNIVGEIVIGVRDTIGDVRRAVSEQLSVPSGFVMRRRMVPIRPSQDGRMARDFFRDSSSAFLVVS